jgi:hypothetical protein
MAGTVKITDRDRGWQKLKREIAGWRGGAYTLVGIQGKEAAAEHVNADGKTVADVATANEFGAVVTAKNGREIVIPMRSFIRATIDVHHARLKKLATNVGQGVLLGKFTTHQALGLLGVEAEGLMRQRIADGIPPPNAPVTIARKGSSTPLIDKGQLRGSLTHKVQA